MKKTSKAKQAKGPKLKVKVETIREIKDTKLRDVGGGAAACGSRPTGVCNAIWE